MFNPQNTIMSTALPADSANIRGNKLPDKKRLIRRIKELYDARREYEERWKEIRDYQLPFVGDFDNTADKTNPGRRRDLKIAHGVAWQACQVFAAGIMSGLTPPSRQWFRFAYKRPELNMNVEAMKVLDQRQEIVQSVLAQSNFYDSAHSSYMELPFGQSPIAVFYDPQNGIRFQHMSIGTYALGVDGYGKVNTFARKYEMTLRQIIDCFGVEHLPEQMKSFAENESQLSKKYTVCWLIEPNDDRLPDKIDRLNMPYRSVYWLEKSQEDEFLYVGGFEEWPVPTARYLIIGNEAYGRGPGWFAEGDSKMLQLLKKDYLTAVELSIKPPMKGSAQLLNNGGINLIPGGLTPVQDQVNQFVEPLFNVNLNLNDAKEEIIRTEDSIKRSYSADLFLMLDNLDNNRMTAREVMERTQEKLQQLGPVTERMQNEFLTLIINRVYNIIDRAGGFPPIPDELADVITEEDIQVDYISPLAQAQKMSGLVNIEQAIAFVGQMAQIWPEVTKKVDPLRTIGKYFENVGAPAVIQRSDEDAMEVLMQEQQEMARQQELQEGLAIAQAAAPAADAAKNLTEAAQATNPALSSWLGVAGEFE